MGYEIHITRREQWFDQQGPEITLDEWLEYVRQDPELRPWDASLSSMGGDASWFPAPGEERAVYYWSKGCISTKPGDLDGIRKAWQIAQYFGARTQGDEGELYGPDGEELTPIARQAQQTYPRYRIGACLLASAALAYLPWCRICERRADAMLKQASSERPWWKRW